MAYLIIAERGGGKVLSARKCTAETPSYWRIVDDIGRLFPGRAPRSPLDACRPNATQLVVYVSDNPAGEGRIAGPFQEWAVDPDPELPNLIDL